MNFKEAMAVISDHTWIYNGWNNNLLYKWLNNKMFYSSKELIEWMPNPSIEKQELEAAWEIYEQPNQQRKGLWDKSKWSDVNVFNITTTDFNNRAQRNYWQTALHTFMKLKSHLLAVKLEDDKIQSLIAASGKLGQVYVTGYSYLNRKLSEISPAFATSEDATKAINDIGEDNLLHMFKTFQGIYE